jgi:preprotein translocase subunit SecG
VQVLQSILYGLSVVVALLFTLLVFFTGKGDAMSGGSAVRTTFKGKANFEDIMSRMTFYLGVGFMGLMLVLDIVGHRLLK